MNTTLLQYAYSRHAGFLPQSQEVDIFVTDALRYVIQNVFRNVAQLFTITISTAETPTELWLQDIMGRLFATWGFMAVKFILQDSKRNYVHVPGRRYCNMILVDSFESLRGTKIAEYNQDYDTSEYYFIFLQIRDSWMTLHRDKILKYCFDNYWLHCNVMIQNGRGEVLVYTYFPFEKSGCFNTDPVLINQFNGKRFVNEEMFPNKLNNFHGCPLKLTTWDVPPFVTYPRNASEKQLSGLEMTLIRALSGSLNFLLQLDDAVLDDDPSANSSSCRRTLQMSNLTYQLQHRQTNITAGYLRRKVMFDEIATPSPSLYSMHLRLVVLPRHNRYTYMTVLIFPFDRYTWILLIIGSISLSCINSIRKKSHSGPSNWVIVEILLGVSTLRVPRNLTLKTAFIIWVISTFFVRSLYQARLFLLYRTNFYEDPPGTVDELMAAGYTAVCTQDSEEFMNTVPEIANKSLPMIVLNTSDELEPLLYLKTHREENLVAAAVADIVMYHLPRELRGVGGIVFTNTILIQQTSLYFPKHSYLAERFNECILYFHQGGLIDRWRQQFTATSKVTTTFGSAIRSYGGSLMIDMKQFSGFMMLIVVLHVLAIIVFALEVASKKRTWLQKSF